ncbi:MAG TPA: hypothetical protein VHZ99_06545 [Steroidobacteraceae bacterium]|jgi:hypothetical protein|nr:hypothetical protein [Steroidobacteraceae bacterium]
MAELLGSCKALAVYFAGMTLCIRLSFGSAFYLTNGLVPFIVVLFFLGFFGGNLALYSLWLPEQYGTAVRATAFALATSIGRLVGAGVNFLQGWAIHRSGTLGMPVAWTAVAFALGLLVIPLATETRLNERLPSNHLVALTPLL